MPTNEHIKSFIGEVLRRQDARLELKLATSSKAGAMSADDKIKLDAIRFDFERGTLSVVTDSVTLTFAAIKKNTP